MNKDVFNRRQFLKVAGATTAGTAFYGLTTPLSWAHAEQVLAPFSEFGISVSPFVLSQVSLLSGPFLDNRTYSNDYNNFTCDHGTGMESNTKYADSIYFASNDGTTLYVNLFIASQLRWTQKNMTITQNTTFPETNTSRITITGSGSMTIKIRVPSWTNNQMQIRVNGTLQTVAVTPNTYAAITRGWQSGDVIDLTMPMSLHLEPTPDSPTTQAVKYGPLVLSGAYGSTSLSTLPSLTTSSIKPVTGTPLQYTAMANNASVTLIPFYKNHQNYTVYWNTH